MTSPNGEDNNTHDKAKPVRSPAEEMLAHIEKVISETYLDKAHNCIVIAESIGYWVPISSIRTELDVFRWLDHLARKNWFTRHHVYRFVGICSDLLGVSLYGENPKPARKSRRRN